MADYLFKDFADGSDPLQRVLPSNPLKRVTTELTDLTVAVIISRYLDELAYRLGHGHLTQHTFDDMRRELHRFVKVFGPQPLASCRQNDLTRWLQLHPQLKAKDTLKRVLATIVGAFKWAEGEEIISKAPYRMPKKIRGRQGIRPEATVAEYVLLMRKGSRALRRLLCALFHSAARPIMARELTVDQIDWQNAVIRKTKFKTMDQEDQPRVFGIGLDDFMLRHLARLVRQLPATQTVRVGPKRTITVSGGQRRVFTNGLGDAWGDGDEGRRALNQHFRRVANRLGLRKELTPYCFRHLYAGDAVDCDMPDRQSADQMGWTTTRMLGRYSHAADRPGYLHRIANEVTQRRRALRRRSKQ